MAIKYLLENLKKKTIPIVRDHYQRAAFENVRMLENEVFAIETFGSTGDGFVRYAKERFKIIFRQFYFEML